MKVYDIINYIYAFDIFRRTPNMDSYKLYSSLPAGGWEKNRAEINVSALVHNRERIMKNLNKDYPLAKDICVVKADAYGHGVAHCVPALARSGCRFFAVSCIEEARALRRILIDEALDADILILGYTPPTGADKLAENDLIQCVFSREYAAALNACATRPLDVHIKIDTGMNRIGFGFDESGIRSAADLFGLSNLKVKGTFTHFSRADEQTPEGDSFTRLQYDRFALAIHRLLELDCDPGFLHACNSAAAIRFPEFSLDGVRLGIALYGAGGLSPDGEPLDPVMSLYSKITHIHTLKGGESLGYGGVYTAISDRVIATLPIGYADGFIRAYSGAWVDVETSDGYKKAKIIGRICMDQCMIDITGLPARVGDSVRIFGGTPSDITALASLAGTIDYECLCTVSARVPRVITY